MDSNGVHVDLDKIQFIPNWPTLETLIELRNFLGFSNFYHIFVLGFSHIARSLNQVTKSGFKAKFVLGKSQQQEFEELKWCVSSAHVLTLLDQQQPFEIESIASDYVVSSSLT